jgi:glutaredoxin
VTGFLVLLPLLWLPAGAQTPGTPAGTSAQAELHVFVRDGCPHCASAKAFLSALGPEDLRGVVVVLRDVGQDEQARSDLERISRAVGAWPPGVPTFLFKDTVLVGFDDSGHTGRALLQLIQQDGARPAVRDQVETQLFGPLNVNRLGLPLFTLALGLLDGFNPCAMWVLLFLLSLLVRLQDRRRMAAIAGTFVLISGAVYYLFMAAWLNLFLFVGVSPLVVTGLALLAMLIGFINLRDGLRPENGFALSIPDSAKPGLYARVRRILQTRSLLPALGGVALLAVVVNFVELLCTAGLPAIYTAVLAQQQLSALAHHAYLGLYIIGYIADDALMVAIAVLALSSRKLTQRSGATLKLISGAVMFALGLVMLLKPQWLQ